MATYDYKAVGFDGKLFRNIFFGFGLVFILLLGLIVGKLQVSIVVEWYSLYFRDHTNIIYANDYMKMDSL